MELKDFYESFRDPKTILSLKKLIDVQAKKLNKSVNIMEVCGGHTHAIMKYGINQLLPSNIKFVHGPGCPVCVMPKSRVDEAIALAKMPDTVLVTLGDMIKVLGSTQTLQDARAQGADVRFVYSPLDTIKIAKENPQKRVIYVAIGFETTTPMSASLLRHVIDNKIENIYFHINHVLVPPPMRAILNDDNVIDAFIGPSHVSVITGSKIYEEFAECYGRPVVVSGFEPVDVMESVLMLIKQLQKGEAKVQIQYSRSVNREGNVKAQALVTKFFDVCDFEFRGLGVISGGGLALKQSYEKYDARKRFAEVLPKASKLDNKNCLCGEILKAKALPHECKLFANACTPATPVGSCMVSSEGACAAYFKYGDFQ